MVGRTSSTIRAGSPAGIRAAAIWRADRHGDRNVGNISRTKSGGFDVVLSRVNDALKTEGCGVLTEIGVAGALKAKFDKDSCPDGILGARNPKLAFRALSAEPDLRAMPPRIVIVQRCDKAGRSFVRSYARHADGQERGARRRRDRGSRRRRARDREDLSAVAGQGAAPVPAATAKPAPRKSSLARLARHIGLPNSAVVAEGDEHE